MTLYWLEELIMESSPLTLTCLPAFIKLDPKWSLWKQGTLLSFLVHADTVELAILTFNLFKHTKRKYLFSRRKTKINFLIHRESILQGIMVPCV